jgi:hypothetical protein
VGFVVRSIRWPIVRAELAVPLHPSCERVTPPPPARPPPTASKPFHSDEHESQRSAVHKKASASTVGIRATVLTIFL